MAELTPVVEGLFDDDGLIGGACSACQRRHFPRAGHCPWCGVAAVSEVRLSTRGHLWSWTVVHAAPPGYAGPVPYGFGVVELPVDGLRVITLLTETDPTMLHEGEPMAYATVSVGDGASSWAFAPVIGEGEGSDAP